MAWHLRLFGVPMAEREDQLLPISLDKPSSLLFYLAERGDWVSRSELAYLYRPDVPESLALSTVRKLLHRARNQPWSETLEVDGSRLRLQVPTDTHAFVYAVTRRDWEAALALHGGEFLHGLAMADTAGYQAWLELERQSLDQQWRKAAAHHADALDQRGRHSEAAEWMGRLLERDPLDEEILQGYLRSLHKDGRRQFAIDVYERFRHDLLAELDLEPLESTQGLVTVIRQNRPVDVADPPVRTPPRHNLPSPTTRFIGRKRELEQLAVRLADGDERLITLVGFGGSGKTRLGIELGWRQLASFPDGVWFVPLAAATSPDLIVPGIANAIGFTFTGKVQPLLELSDYLREKRMLLLLDNLEHLLDGTPLLASLLEIAPSLHVVATSRTALGLQGEVLVDLDGLEYPTMEMEDARDDAMAPEHFDAIELFVNRAARVAPGWVLDQATLQAVASICRRVEGLPLALELAAAWTRALDVSEIDRSLAADLASLSSTQRDLPVRHRSVSAVFEHSWRLLGKAEQDVLCRLSLFRGGFDLPAGEAVAGAHPPLLLSLMNHSLVRRERERRYGLHELVRHLALTRLDETARLAAERRFYRHYLQLLADREREIRGPRRAHVMHEFQVDLDNFRTAHRLAVAAADWDALDPALGGLHTFFWEANLVHEGRAMFAAVTSALEADGARGSDHRRRLLARARLRLGMFQRDSGVYDEARAHLEESARVLRELGPADELARALQLLSTVARQKGQLAEAETFLEESLALCRTIEDDLLLAHALYSLAQLKRERGQYREERDVLEACLSIRERMGDAKGVILATSHLGTLAREFEGDTTTARRHTEHALELSRQLGDLKNEAIELNNLAAIAFDEGNELQSEAHLRASLAIKEHLGHLSGQMTSHNNLGELFAAQERFDQALHHLGLALGLARQLGTPRGQVLALAELGETACRKGDAELARQHFESMLRLALTADIPPRIILRGLCHLAEFQRDQGEPEGAVLLARYLVGQPGILKKTRDQASALLDLLEPALPPVTTERLRGEAAALSPEAVLELQLRLLER